MESFESLIGASQDRLREQAARQVAEKLAWQAELDAYDKGRQETIELTGRIRDSLLRAQRPYDTGFLDPRFQDEFQARLQTSRSSDLGSPWFKSARLKQQEALDNARADALRFADEHTIGAWDTGVGTWSDDMRTPMRLYLGSDGILYRAMYDRYTYRLEEGNVPVNDTPPTGPFRDPSSYSTLDCAPSVDFANLAPGEFSNSVHCLEGIRLGLVNLVVQHGLAY